jgi:hypothetical protein
MNNAKKEMLGKRLGRALAETDFRNRTQNKEGKW